jgi:large subunit ribosomal protein L30
MAEEQETTKETPVEEKKAPVTSAGSGKLAVILVRGMVSLTHSVKDTLRILKLGRKNTCVVVDDTPIIRGMIKKIKDFVTWGEISDARFAELVEKRGEEFKGRLQDSKKKYSYSALEISGKKYKTYFRLNPPRKGFGRKGVKVAFKVGGALGYRGEKMDDLIERML